MFADGLLGNRVENRLVEFVQPVVGEKYVEEAPSRDIVAAQAEDTHGRRPAVKLVLSGKDRVVGVQGYAGTGKTTMQRRPRALMGRKGYKVRGLAPSASAARTLEAEAGIGRETLQRFLARNAGVAEGRMTRKGAREMRAAFRKTALVVDEGSLASTVQARDLLRIADALRIPRMVTVGDAKQLDAVDAGTRRPTARTQCRLERGQALTVNILYGSRKIQYGQHA